MHNLPRSRYLVISFALILILVAACGPASGTPTATLVPPGGGGSGGGTSGIGSSLLPENFNPTPGMVVLWVDGNRIVYLPPGEFDMGKGSEAENAPAHIVGLDGFWFFRTEVTNRAYKRCVASGNCALPSEAGIAWYQDPFYSDLPVTGVDWSQAQAYCNWASGILPSEAQWEYAAAGPEHSLYPWGNIAPACDLLNYNNCLNPAEPDFVGSYKLGKSLYGLMDMGGNVMEWVNDFYSPNYYLDSPATNPGGPDSGETRVVRGGGFDSPEELVRTSTRSSLVGSLAARNVGFRCMIVSDSVASSQIAPICYVGGYVPHNDNPDGPTPVPGVPAPITPLAGYCEYAGGANITGVNIDVGQPVSDPNAYEVTGPMGPLTCVVTPGFPDRLTCYGEGLNQDHTVSVTVCPPGVGEPPSPTPAAQEPVCPTGYAWDLTEGVCRYTPVEQVGGTCPPGYTVDGDACLPNPNSDGECPQGYYPYGNLCAPLGGTPSSCLPGYSYSTSGACCMPPQGVEPDCPDGYAYNPDQHLCNFIDTSGGETPACQTFTFYIPVCEGPTPIPQTIDTCNTYVYQYACLAIPSCRWIPNTITPWYGTCVSR